MKKLGVILAIICLSLTTSCGGGGGDSGGSTNTKRNYTVKYLVTTNASVPPPIVVYVGFGQSVAQEDNISLPWEHSFEAKSGDYLSVSAVGDGNQSALTATIEVDGVEVDRSGPGFYVDTNYTLP